MARIILGLFLILAGLSALTGFSLFKFLLAAVLVAVGIKLISGRKRHGWQCFDKTPSHEDVLNEVAVFSPLNKAVESDNFRGGKAVIIFSGGEIDLSKASSSEKEIELEIVAIFGGAKVIIPKDWRVKSNGTAIFGGYSNRVEKSEGGTILNLKGAAIFGGIEITN